MNSNEIKSGVIKPVECFKEGWQLIKDDYWILFAVSFIGIVVSGLSLYIVLGAMVCGMFYCFLKVIDGGKAEVDGLFKGFKFFGAGFVVMMVIVVPMIAVFSLVTLPAILSATGGVRMTEEELLAWLFGTLIVEFILAVVMVCLHTLLMFSFPLIVDKKLSGLEAIKVSAMAVWKNLNGVAGLWAVGFLVSLVGFSALCFGIYFVIPIIIAGNTVAYRKIFPADLVSV